VLRPYNTRKTNEILAAPKVYGFDTGFVCFFKGWDSLRRDDYGLLWEHLVLNEVQGKLQTGKVHYWRDKKGHEIDLVLGRRGTSPIAIECKYKSSDADFESFGAFRRNYPEGKNYVVSREFGNSQKMRTKDLEVHYVSLADLVRELSDLSSARRESVL
jgi:predicted AAA+ superfamily ATPase